MFSVHGEMTGKEKIKYFFLCLGIVICIDLLIVGIAVHRNDIMLMGYTEYDLSIADLSVMLVCFDVYIPEYKESATVKDFVLDNRYNSDKRRFELVQGIHCEQQIEKFNILLFEDCKSENALKLAEEYGFSSEKRITAEWIVTHPKEAIKIIDSDLTVFWYDLIKDYYDIEWQYVNKEWFKI